VCACVCVCVPTVCVCVCLVPGALRCNARPTISACSGLPRPLHPPRRTWPPQQPPWCLKIFLPFPPVSDFWHRRAGSTSTVPTRCVCFACVCVLAVCVTTAPLTVWPSLFEKRSRSSFTFLLFTHTSCAGVAQPATTACSTSSEGGGRAPTTSLCSRGHCRSQPGGQPQGGLRRRRGTGGQGRNGPTKPGPGKQAACAATAPTRAPGTPCRTGGLSGWPAKGASQCCGVCACGCGCVGGWASSVETQAVPPPPQLMGPLAPLPPPPQLMPPLPPLPPLRPPPR